MIEVKDNEASNILEAEFIETFTETDLDHFIPVVEKHVAEESQPCMLIIMQEFNGWDKASTLWNDIKLDSRYINKFDRIALVGDKKWEEWLTKIVAPFTPNNMRYFKPSDITHARKWLQ